MPLQALLERIKETAQQHIASAQSLDQLNQIRSQLLGKRSELAEAMKHLKEATPEERPLIGARINDVRTQLTAWVEARREALDTARIQLALQTETIDVTLPGRQPKAGQSHVLTQIIDEIEDLFIGMGYFVAEGPEVERDLYNFEMMNLPKDHPARDMQDTFYITEETLLRTHTSPVQARTLLAHDWSQGPLKMICPGKVYRRDDDDATHSHQFHQVEGLVVAEGISMADLKGTLAVVAKQLFGEARDIRLRPSYFPFTEPSVEVDVSCFKCGGEGCAVCKQTGWIEVLGAGMVHPQVLAAAGVDTERYSGFAFGLGIERIAMLRYGVEDIRNFYLNDQRFLSQFRGGK